MTRLLLTTGCLFQVSIIWSQIDTISSKTDTAAWGLIGVRPIQPSYPGGEQAMYDFMRKNLRFPGGGECAGTVFVGFEVDSTGYLHDIRVLKGIPDCPRLDAEALRLVGSFPKWQPGDLRSRVKMVLPIRFKPY